MLIPAFRQAGSVVSISEVIAYLASKPLTFGEKRRSYTMSSQYPEKVYELSVLDEESIRS